MKRILLSILAIGILLLSSCGTPAAEPPAPATYTLSVSVNPLGAGSVSPSDGQYEEGARVTLTATPAGDYAFDYWDGDASGSSANTTIIMDSDKSIIAHFATTSLTTYTLSASVSPSRAGSVSPSDGQYEEGAQVTLTATPASGYIFDYWDGDASGSSATTIIIIDSDKTFTAHFVTMISTITQKDVADAQQVVWDYWDAFNSYDVELTLSYLEESFRQERGETLTDEIGRMKFPFRIRIKVTKEAEPVITSEGIIGIIEIIMRLRTPIGAKIITYHLVKVNGEWKISEAIEEE